MEKSIVYFENNIYDLEDHLYAIVGPNTIVEIEITAFKSYTFKDDNNNIIVRHYAVRPAQIIVENYFPAIKIDEVPFNYLKREQSEAENLASFKKVDVSIEVWEKILGYMINEQIEECELDYFDCHSFNFVKDVLLRCFSNKGLTNLEINWIKADLCPMIPPEFMDKIPHLVKILEELGITPEIYVRSNHEEKL